jgi:hypothetical protein
MVGFDIGYIDEAFRALIAGMQMPAPVLRVELRTEPMAAEHAEDAEDAEAPLQLNAGRLREALEFITANPRYWQQNLWARRNPAASLRVDPDDQDAVLIGCLGYHIVRLAGHRHGYVGVCGETWTVADGRHMYEVAREEIGLSRLQANSLFHPGNSLMDLWDIAERITQGAITSPSPKKEKELAW